MAGERLCFLLKYKFHTILNLYNQSPHYKNARYPTIPAAPRVYTPKRVFQSPLCPKYNENKSHTKHDPRIPSLTSVPTPNPTPVRIWTVKLGATPGYNATAPL